jgi:hypothetical protein
MREKGSLKNYEYIFQFFPDAHNYYETEKSFHEICFRCVKLVMRFNMKGVLYRNGTLLSSDLWWNWSDQPLPELQRNSFPKSWWLMRCFLLHRKLQGERPSETFVTTIRLHGIKPRETVIFIIKTSRVHKLFRYCLHSIHNREMRRRVKGWRKDVSKRHSDPNTGILYKTTFRGLDSAPFSGKNPSY